MSTSTSPLSIESLNQKFKDIYDVLKKGNNEIKDKVQLLVLVSHVAFLNVGFRDESYTEENNSLINHSWNVNEPYTFRYKHSQSQLVFELKCITLSNRLLIHGTAIPTNDTHSLELIPDDYIPDQVTFPLKDEKELVNYFNNKGKLELLVEEIKVKLIQKLIPGLQKLGYSETQTGQIRPLQSRNDVEIEPGFEPRVPFQQNPPSFERVDPFRYGDQDLNPLGGMGMGMGIPRYGGGGNALDPFGMSNNRGGGGGMIFDPSFHPSAPSNPMGSGRLPPGAAPPGARFDPITPSGDILPSRGRPSRRTDPFSGEPDNDELPPTGNYDMYM